MKGLILAAGFGKRLRPLTFKKPKVLMPILNTPIIDQIIEFLKKHNVKEIILNTHYLHEQIREYISSKEFGIPVHVIFEPRILGTGGAIKNVEYFWRNEPLLVINGDIVTNINISKAYKWHIENNSLVTLILHRYPRFKKIIINENLEIIEIKDDEIDIGLSFTGIHIIEPELLNYMPKGYFDIVNFYKKLMKNGISIKGYISQGHYWRDIGTIKDYIEANKEALKNKSFFIDTGSAIHPSARLLDWAVIGKNCFIEEDTIIKRSILWDNTIIKKGTKVIDSIVTGGEVKKDIKNLVA